MEEPIITEEELELDFDEDLAEGRYQVWIIDEGSEYERLIQEFSDADEAKSLADLIDSETIYDYTDVPRWVGVVVVQIETVVELDGCDTNVGTIYKRNIIL